MLGIVGMGLIGGSIAKAARGYDTILGFDTDESVITRSVKEGVIDRGYTELEHLKECDFVVIALPLSAEMTLMQQASFQQNAVVADVCGVKRMMDFVPGGIDYVSAHPMAGKEVGGYENSDATLFEGANFILVGREGTSRRAMEKVRHLAEYIGCGNIFEASREEHDRMIAFTSQLPHALAACMVSLEDYSHCQGYEGGSLADFTRIAQMDSRMWSELFLMNREPLLGAIERLEGQLKKLHLCLADRDKEELNRFLQNASNRREAHE